MTDHELQTIEILLLPFFGQGHILPFLELGKHLSATHNFGATFLIPSSLSSSIPSSVRHHHPGLRIVEITSSASPHHPPPLPGPLDGPRLELINGLESFILGQPVRPTCVIIDVMMSWVKDVFDKFGVPRVALFTSGACSAAMEYGYWKAHVTDLKPGEARMITGLPEEMAVLYSDIQRHDHHPHMPMPRFGPPGPRPPRSDGTGFDKGPPGPPRPDLVGFDKGPPRPGQMPVWVTEVEGTVGIMMNTCDDLEGPFLKYVANQIKKPVWGVGPLLPKQYWNADGVSVHDHDVRANRQSNYTEEEVIQWLDLKPQESVVYVSFGTEVGPTMEEYAELASALEETTRPFIWVIQKGSGRSGPPPHPVEGQRGTEPPEGYNPLGLENMVGNRGLIIRGWAPQLIILSHTSVGGFLSHCGWNSVVEAIGRGVPLLAWPIRGDQHHHAKLVTNHLKVGCMVKDNSASSTIDMVKKDDIIRGIQALTSNASIKQRANALQANFRSRVPQSSGSALEAFRNYVLAINDSHN